MRRAMHFLVILAVLWCGLHLSPAEAVETCSHDQTELAFQFQTGDGEQRDHVPSQVAHACHSHCPNAFDEDRGAAISAPISVKTALFAAPAKELNSVTKAPPVEPPAA